MTSTEQQRLLRLKQTLLADAKLLDVEEILDICYHNTDNSDRLLMYLKVLREKEFSLKAQVAATFICFDLAKKGDLVFEAEFELLIPVVEETFIPKAGVGLPKFFQEFLETSPYLQNLHMEIITAVNRLDRRSDAPTMIPLSASVLDSNGIEEVIELDLFDVEEILDIEVEMGDVLDESILLLDAEWQECTNFFLGLNPTPAQSNENYGFQASSRKEMSRVRKLHKEAMSYAGQIESATQLLPLVELFMASHLRAKNIFGRPNQKRVNYLQAGLMNFVNLKNPLSNQAAWLNTPTAYPFAWEKTAEVLLDFISFLGTECPKFSERKCDLEVVVGKFCQEKGGLPTSQRLNITSEKRRR